MGVLIRVLVWWTGRFRLQTLRRLGKFLGWVVYLCAGSRRRVAFANLDLAYGDSLSAEDKKTVARSCFKNLMTTGLEFCWSYSNVIPPEHKMKVLNPEVFKEAAAEGKGVILLVPHMGNWEISARWFSEEGYTTHAVSRKQKQEWVTRFVRETRRINGLREIDKANALKPVLSAIRRGEIVLMLIDQYARKDAVEVEFFGKPAMTTASVALLAARTGCKVQVACCFRFPDGAFGGVFSDPIETTVSGDRDQDLVENTQRYVSEIEEFVRKYPQDWMWMHRRWKEPRRSRPKNATQDIPHKC